METRLEKQIREIKESVQTTPKPVLFRKLRSGNYARCYSTSEATEVLLSRQVFYNLIDKATREGKRVIKATYRMSQTYYTRYDNLQLAAEKMGL